MRKANLLVNNNTVLNGYVNIDPYAVEGDGKIQGDVTDLSHCIDDDELDELVADSVLEYFGAAMVPQVLSNWVRKIKKGGKIVISTPDIYEIARGIVRRDISEDDANILLFGTQDKDGSFKRNAYSMKKVEQLLSQLGMSVTSRRFVTYKLVITAEKV